MAIARSTLGTQSGKSGTSLSITGLTLATGDLLLIGTHQRDVNVSTISWNGISIATPDANSGGVNATGVVDIWSKVVATGATGDIVVNYDAAITNGATIIAIKVTGGATVSPVDKSKGNDWTSSVNATSTATTTTAQAAELLFGCIGIQGPNTDSVPTWLNSFNAGQNVGTSGGTATNNSTLFEGYLIVASTGTYTAAGTLGTTRIGGACIVTIKENTTVSPATIAQNVTEAAMLRAIGPVTQEDAVGFAATTIVAGAVTIAAGLATIGCAPDDTHLSPLYLAGPLQPDIPTTLFPFSLGFAGNLGDGNLGTYAQHASTVGQSSGTLTISQQPGDFSSIAGRTDAISGIVLHVYAECTAFNLGSGYPTITGASFNVNVGNYSTATPVRNDEFYGPHVHLYTSLITTDPNGGGAWLWANLQSHLVLTSYNVTWTGSNNQSLILRVSEMWVEVWGPQGSKELPILLQGVYRNYNVTNPASDGKATGVSGNIVKTLKVDNPLH